VPHDPKQGERDYYARIGAEGISHSLAKPFVDDDCRQHLAEMTALFGLLEAPPRRIAEFGCGTGWLAFYLAERGYDVLGIDISADAIRHAQAAAAARGLSRATFAAADFEAFEPGGMPFDYVVFCNSLHHAESEAAALRCAYAALRPGGCAITLEPGSEHSRAPASVRAVEQYQVHEKDMPPARIVRAARSAGFRRHLVLPHPYQLNRHVYRRTYHRVASRGELKTRRLLGVVRSVWQLLRWRPDPGMVVMWK
jgi:SAM-dependent methyltransferase